MLEHDGDIVRVSVPHGKVQMILIAGHVSAGFVSEDGFSVGNCYPCESFARSRFLSDVAKAMRDRANELRAMADDLDERRIEG